MWEWHWDGPTLHLATAGGPITHTWDVPPSRRHSHCASCETFSGTEPAINSPSLWEKGRKNSFCRKSLMKSPKSDPLPKAAWPPPPGEPQATQGRAAELGLSCKPRAWMSPEPPTHLRGGCHNSGLATKGCSGACLGTSTAGPRHCPGAGSTLWWQSRCHCRNTCTTPAAAQSTLYRRAQDRGQSWERCLASLTEPGLGAGPAHVPRLPTPSTRSRCLLNKLNALVLHTPNPGLGQEEAPVQCEGHDVAGDLPIVLF